MMDAIIDMSNKRAANESRNQTLTEISDFAEKYRLGELFYASVVTWAATRITMGAAYDKKAAEAISSIEKDMVSNIDDLFPEARKITSYADFYEVETMEGLKIRISKSEIPSSIFNEIDDIASKMARETFNKNSADPFRDVLGSGLQSNPTEWNDIIGYNK